MPEIELHTVHDASAPSPGWSRAELTFAATSGRARLAAVRLQKLVGMGEVLLGPIG